MSTEDTVQQMSGATGVDGTLVEKKKANEA
jgi:hypothetical protein